MTRPDPVAWFAVAWFAVMWLSACGSSPATPEAAQTAAPPAWRECTADAKCQDGLSCNGQERCRQSRCSAGPSPRCDDGDPCTADGCNEPHGCLHVEVDSPGCTPSMDAAVPLEVPDPVEAGVRLPPGDEAMPPEVECPTSVNAVVAETNGDLAPYAGVQCVSGAVVIGPDVTDLSALSELRRAGSISRYGAATELLSQLSELVRIDSGLNLSERSDDSGSLSMPALHWVGGQVSLQRLVQEPEPFPALRYLGGEIRVLSTQTDAPLVFPALRTMGGNLGGDTLAAVTFPQLDTIGGNLSVLAAGTGLDTLVRLRRVGGLLLLRGTDFDGVLALPALEELGMLSCVGNPALTGFDFPRLSKVSRVDVRLNPQLSRCEVDALGALVHAPVGSDAHRACCNLGCTACDGARCAGSPDPLAGQSTELFDFGHIRGIPFDALATVSRVDELDLSGIAANEAGQLPTLALREADTLWLSRTGLESMAPLSALRRVGLLGIVDNYALLSLSGLDALERVDTLVIRSNRVLVDISALDPSLGVFRELSTSGEVSHNGTLPQCQAETIGFALASLSGAPVEVANNAICAEE